jgi:hypothetical protein
VVGCTIGSRREVPGGRKCAISDDDDDDDDDNTLIYQFNLFIKILSKI